MIDILAFFGAFFLCAMIPLLCAGVCMGVVFWITWEPGPRRKQFLAWWCGPERDERPTDPGYPPTCGDPECQRPHWSGRCSGWLD